MITATLDDLIRTIEAGQLLWRVSSPGVMGEGTRAEAMIRSAGKPWLFGYGWTVEAALSEALAKWRAQK